MSQSLADFPDGWERALVIAAHPDDIEWGAAAAVAAWTAAGKEVVYVLVTSGEAGIDTMDPEGATVTRQAEEHASASIVGVARRRVPRPPRRSGRGEPRTATGPGGRHPALPPERRRRPEPRRALGTRCRAPAGTAPTTAPLAGPPLTPCPTPATDGSSRSSPPTSRGTACSGSPIAGSARGTHAVDVTDVLDVGVASLAAHAEYLRALGTEDPEAFARQTLSGQTTAVAERFGGRAGIAFELIRGPAAP